MDGRVRMDESFVWALLTPAGSTAYNYSTHGPILPIDADVFALTALNAFDQDAGVALSRKRRL